MSRYLLKGRRRYVSTDKLAAVLLPDATKMVLGVSPGELSKLLMEAYRMGHEDGKLGLRIWSRKR